MFRHRPDQAIAMIDAILAWARSSRIPAFAELYHRIKRHRNGIIASVTHGLPNALTESVNTKLRLLTRIAYGFRSTDNPSRSASWTDAATAHPCPAEPDPWKEQESQKSLDAVPTRPNTTVPA